MITTLPYSTIDLTSEEIGNILSVFNSLQDDYNVDFKKDFAFPFHEFSLFETYQQYATGPVIEVKQNANAFYISFTQVIYRLHSASRYAVAPTGEYQTWCVLPLNRQYGHILVKSETLLDKIHELIHPIEIDFKEDPDFSREFYVLASDESMARDLVDTRFRNAVKQSGAKDIWIEVSQNHLIVGNKKRIDTQASLGMADFLNRVAELNK